MRSLPMSNRRSVSISKQRGVVLFFALIALLAISLAAVALVRSVDTSAMIAGNLSFKQSATASGDSGIEAAMAWMAGIEAANANTNILMDAAHPFNITDLGTYHGYFSSADPALDLTANATWDDVNDQLVGTDSSGNKIRYIIQRMCRKPNVAIKDAGCLFSGAAEDKDGQQIRLPQEVCQGTGCPVAGQTPQIRITARVEGPKFTVSYVQAYVY